MRVTPIQAKVIIQNYGVDHQQRKLAEEVFELQQAIDRYGTVGTISSEKREREHIAEEIADVRHLLKQFMGYFDITEGEVARIEKEKFNRQLVRMQEEQKC